jgi:hypothetical protein
MNKDLELLKQIIDAGIQRGIFTNAESVENSFNALRRVAVQVGEYERWKQSGDGAKEQKKTNGQAATAMPM